VRDEGARKQEAGSAGQEAGGRRQTIRPVTILFSKRQVLYFTVLPPASCLLPPSSLFDHSDIRQIAITLGEIQAIADHEFVRDLKAHIIGFDLNLAAIGFVK
jgi:hypothetical protein